MAVLTFYMFAISLSLLLPLLLSLPLLLPSFLFLYIHYTQTHIHIIFFKPFKRKLQTYSFTPNTVVYLPENKDLHKHSKIIKIRKLALIQDFYISFTDLNQMRPIISTMPFIKIFITFSPTIQSNIMQCI